MYKVNCYNTATEGNVKLSANFAVKEFKCNDGSRFVFIDQGLVSVLQMIRNHYKSPIIINSAYRTPDYNAKVGGAKGSMHMTGCAADFYVRNVPAHEVYDWLCKKFPDTLGIGKYKTFTHLDTRLEKARWVG